MSLKISVIFLLIVVSYLISEVASKVEFTNIVCTSLDKEFSDFEYCYLKSVNRTYKYLSVKCKFFKLPIEKVKINLSMHKRFNGYRPFMYNITVDACRFLKNEQSNPVLHYFYSFIKPFTTKFVCPYREDAIVVEKLPYDFINNKMTNVLPFPEGDYLVVINWIAYDIHRGVTKLYFTLS